MKSLTEKERKGVDISIRVTSKKFPFIKGWKFPEDYIKYDTNIYVDLNIDWESFSKFANLEWKSHFLENPEKREPTNGLGVYFLPSIDSPGFEEKSEQCRLIKLGIINNLNMIYNSLPSDYIRKWKSNFGEYDVSLEISEFY